MLSQMKSYPEYWTTKSYGTGRLDKATFLFKICSVIRPGAVPQVTGGLMLWPSFSEVVCG